MTNTNAVAYTTSTGGVPAVEVEFDVDPWCYACNRPTDHRAEHDELVEAGLARYDSDLPYVYFNPLGLLQVW